MALLGAVTYGRHRRSGKASERCDSHLAFKEGGRGRAEGFARGHFAGGNGSAWQAVVEHWSGRFRTTGGPRQYDPGLLAATNKDSGSRAWPNGASGAGDGRS